MSKSIDWEKEEEELYDKLFKLAEVLEDPILKSLTKSIVMEALINQNKILQIITHLKDTDIDTDIDTEKEREKIKKFYDKLII